MSFRPTHVCIIPLALMLILPALTPAESPRTVAETSNYQTTSRHAEVIDFCQRLALTSPVVRLSELGVSREGRSLPLLILADPQIGSAEEAKASKKLVVFAFANIHAGEVDGKEALLMLARELALAKDHPLLKKLVIVLAPIFNADGNEKLGNHRPQQAGPALVGTRANADGFDLNRDFVKLETPEVQALLRFLNTWDPVLVIDCHTTNGSYHRYTLTYEGGRCPAGDPRLVRYLQDKMLPDVTTRLRKATGYDSFFYGNFNADRSRWETVPPTPRYGIHYVGLRNRLAILSESYSYASFKDRVLASKGFVENNLAYIDEHDGEIRELLASARADAKGLITLKDQPALLGRPVLIRGFVEEKRDGQTVPTTTPRDYECVYLAGSEPVIQTARPFAYLIPASLTKVVANLERHGIVLEELTQEQTVAVEAYQVTKITRAPAFQKHQPVTLDVASRKETRSIPAGMVCARTAQPLGSLVAYLLEPQSADGLTTWNFFDDVLTEGNDFPVLRVPAQVPLTTRARTAKP
jgi:hypothetical protein